MRFHSSFSVKGMRTMFAKVAMFVYSLCCSSELSVKTALMLAAQTSIKCYMCSQRQKTEELNGLSLTETIKQQLKNL